jgi:GntR family transcriptional regulator
MYCVDYVPRTLFGDDIEAIDWSGSLLDLLEAARQRPRMSAASVSAVMLPPDVVERYDLGDFGPALLISEAAFTPLGLPVVYAVDYHRGSHFTFSLIRK